MTAPATPEPGGIDLRAPIASNDIGVDLVRGLVQFTGRRAGTTIVMLTEERMSVPIGFILETAAQLTLLACRDDKTGAVVRAAMQQTPARSPIALPRG